MVNQYKYTVARLSIIKKNYWWIVDGAQATKIRSPGSKTNQFYSRRITSEP